MTPQPADVRLARPGDEELLFALVRASDDEWTLMPRSYDKVRAVVRMATSSEVSPDAQPRFGVIDGPHGIEAAIGLYPTQPWDSDAHYLRAFFLYVAPDCRRSTHAKHLMQFAKWFGELAALPVVFELLHPERTEAGRALAVVGYPALDPRTAAA